MTIPEGDDDPEVGVGEVIEREHVVQEREHGRHGEATKEAQCDHATPAGPSRWILSHLLHLSVHDDVRGELRWREATGKSDLRNDTTRVDGIVLGTAAQGDEQGSTPPQGPGKPGPKTLDVACSSPGSLGRKGHPPLLRWVRSEEIVMTGTPSAETIDEAVRLATRAPSVHNTQPWQWRYAAGTMDLLRRPDPTPCAGGPAGAIALHQLRCGPRSLRGRHEGSRLGLVGPALPGSADPQPARLDQVPEEACDGSGPSTGRRPSNAAAPIADR